MSTRPVHSIIHEITGEDDFEAEVVRSAVPVLVDFTTAWCPPCRQLAPILHKLAEEHAGRVKVVNVDGDAQAPLAARLRVRGFPTVVAFAGGREVGRHLGLTTRDRLLQLVQAHVAPAAAGAP